MRSDSLLSPETHSVKASLSGTVAENGVDTDGRHKALAGKSGTALIRDYRGKGVSSYAPLNIGGLKWAILAEMDEAKAFALSRHLRNMAWVIGGIAAFIVALCALWIAATLSNRCGRSRKRPGREIRAAGRGGPCDVTG
jgi:methyl-accepting chemotaxis protein